MAAFGTDIANRALVHLGQRAIADIDDTDDVNAVLCKAHLRQSTEYALRGHPWNDAYRRELIGADATAPAFGFAYRYTLPGACLRVLRVNQDKNAIWRKEGARSIVTDIAAPLQVEWISDGADVGGIRDPMLFEVVAVHLAWALCLKVAQDKRLKADLFDQFLETRREARTIDAQEGSMMEEEEESAYLSVRR